MSTAYGTSVTRARLPSAGASRAGPGAKTASRSRTLVVSRGTNGSNPASSSRGAANGGYGAGRAVPADKAECRLWVQKRDDRRNAPQRARCAVTGRSSDEGNRRCLPIAPFAGATVMVLINNLWWPRRSRYDPPGRSVPTRSANERDARQHVHQSRAAHSRSATSAC
jgi:hypothetical protein